ncbi:MAG TPA: ATP-binding protein [Kofleriaceae bacterium]|nr:ATP-binding protein [Kofleriaceae bacterium]
MQSIHAGGSVPDRANTLSDTAPLVDIVSAAPGLMCLLDGEGRCRAASTELAALIGVPARDLVGRPWAGLFDGEEMATLVASDVKLPLRLRRPDGSIRWVDVSSVPVTGGGRLCAVKDVTVQRRVREADTRLRRVLAHAPLLLFALDDLGTFTAIEGRDPEGLASALSTRGTELIGQSVFEVWAEIEDLVGSCRRALAGGEHASNFIWYGHHVDASFEPIRDAQGQVTGMVGVLLDVTGQKQLDLAIQRWESRMVESERLAVLGSLAGGIAHQINDALTATRLSLGRLISFELAQTPMTPVRQHRIELLQDAREGISRVEHITKELRAFSQSETDISLNQSIDLRSVVDAAVNLAAHEIRHYSRLECDLRTLPPVQGGEQALRQVFLNLLINAVQALPEGAADYNTIRVSCWTDELGNAVVEVTDTGKGIAPGDLGRIFEPFFTTRAAGEGLGLGLSVCRDIVNGLSGHISAESAPGRGTVFRVVLPPAPPAEETQPRQSAQTNNDRRRVLIVDDDRPVAAAVALELEDHDVVVAGSGREAFEILRRDPAFDVVLCDVMMPELSGVDLYNWLRPIEPQMLERFVFMTGGAFTARAEQFLRDIPNPRLDKPFHPDDLRRVIASVPRVTRPDPSISIRTRASVMSDRATH